MKKNEERKWVEFIIYKKYINVTYCSKYFCCEFLNFPFDEFLRNLENLPKLADGKISFVIDSVELYPNIPNVNGSRFLKLGVPELL